MSRVYVVFGSDDKLNWERLGEINAGGAPQALRWAIAKESHRHYLTASARYITAVTPEVEQRDPIVRLRPMGSAQLTVDDALSQEP